MSEHKAKHNRAWVATDQYKENYERIFNKSKDKKTTKRNNV